MVQGLGIWGRGNVPLGRPTYTYIGIGNKGRVEEPGDEYLLSFPDLIYVPESWNYIIQTKIF